MKAQILVKDEKGERIAPQVLCEYLMLALLEQCGEQVPEDHVGQVHCSFRMVYSLKLIGNLEHI